MARSLDSVSRFAERRVGTGQSNSPVDNRKDCVGSFMDVEAWLRGLGLGQYEAAFRHNGIDDQVLPHLTAEDLKEIGVATVGDRRKLLAAIGGLPSPLSKRVAEVSAERRPITVMFCDLVGSTSLAARLDPEDWRNLVGGYLDEASAAVAQLGGYVLKRLGDGLMALFGYPQAQENDAERAVRAALAIQRALAEINVKNSSIGAPELSARIGLDLGPVVVDATGEVFGDAPNVASRLQATAKPGSILVTANVQRQTAGLFVAEDRGAHALKGLLEPVTLYRIVRTSGGGRRGGARTMTPFVGRDDELGLLVRRWERARKGEGQLALVVGEPGIGKSRLLEEFHARLGEKPYTWGEWSASQLLQNTPLHPITEWGRQRFGADLPVEQRLADLEGTLRLIGLDPIEYAPLLAPLVDIPLPPARAASFPPEEMRRRQLAAAVAWVLAGARSQAIALTFEDLHWADPTSLDLMQALAERGAQAPLLIIATARPEFRPPWSLRSHHIVISLSPLGRAQVARMVGELASRHALSKDVVEKVSERTGGVPLFVEEVTRLLLERGVDAGAEAIPPTLQQSLAARLDRLGPAREVAQIGAVLGRGFTYALLRDVANPGTGLGDAGPPGTTDLSEVDKRGQAEAKLHSALERLVEADILVVDGVGLRANYRFKHALIQDAAYESLLRTRRKTLHRRAAEILLRQPERAAAEFGGDRASFHRGGPRRRRNRMVGQSGRSGAAPLGLPGGDRPSQQGDRNGGQGRGPEGGGRLGSAAAVAGRLRKRAHRGTRSRRTGNDGGLCKGARVGARRHGRARTIGGRLWALGRRIRARRAGGDEGAGGGLPRRRRNETQLARGRRRASMRRNHSLVRGRVRRSARSPGTRARIV